LFIYGGVGLGKTHLLHAIGSQISQKSPSLIVEYLSAETFINDLIQAIQHEKMRDFQNKYRSIDVLLVDDVQFMATQERTQEEFFHTFNALYDSQKQIVVTSDKVPKDIPELEERLQSRFEWGLIADIQLPDMETRAAILNKKAAVEDIDLPSDVCHFLARHIQSNVRILEGSLTRVKAFAEMSGKPMSIELCKDLLKDILSTKRSFVSIEEVIRVVAKQYGLKPAELKSPKRAKQITRARQIAMYLCRELTSESFPEIGSRFGGRDHATVIHGVNKITSLLEVDSDLQRDIQLLGKSLMA